MSHTMVFPCTFLSTGFFVPVFLCFMRDIHSSLSATLLNGYGWNCGWNSAPRIICLRIFSRVEGAFEPSVGTGREGTCRLVERYMPQEHQISRDVLAVDIKKFVCSGPT